MAEEIESDVDSIEVLELVEAAETGDAVEDDGTETESDETASAETIVDNDPYGQILTVTEKGFGKRTPIRSYRLTSRGAQGVSNIRLTDKNGKVAGAAHVYAGDQLLLITEQGMMIRVACDDIRSMGRNTQGVRVINIDEGDTVVGAVKVVDREGDDREDAPLATSETGEEMDAGESSGESIDESGGEEGTDEEPVH
jgi:DNA gyrase subunit A